MIAFATRRPLAFSLVVALVPVVGTKLLRAALVAVGVPDLGTRLIVEAAFCGYVILLLWRLRWWREAGFTSPWTMRRPVAWLPLLLLLVLVLVGNRVQAASAERMIGFALFTVMIGFAEEGLMRGVVLRALLPGGALRAAVLSSVIFGAGHLANIVQGAAPAATLVQVIVAALLGLAVAGARVYTGTIWPAIALHALIDLVSFASRGFSLAQPPPMTVGRAVVPIALTGVFALYGWWLLSRAPDATPPEASRDGA